jgi:hypothetical protein
MENKRLNFEIMKTLGVGVFCNKWYVGVVILFISIEFEHTRN